MSSKPSRGSRSSREAWTARVAALGPGQSASPRTPLTVALVINAALRVVSAEGYEALTMRKVAAELHVTPGALYVHVRDKAELDDLMIGRLSAAVILPKPTTTGWKQAFLDTCRQLRDQYAQYPGIARAVFSTAPDNLDSLRITEGLLSILLGAGIPARAAAWAADAALLQVAASSVIAVRRDPQVVDKGKAGDRSDSSSSADPGTAHAEMLWRFQMLPRHLFPSVVDHAEELLSGGSTDRFDFALNLLLDGLHELASTSTSGAS